MKFERILWVEDNPLLTYFPIFYQQERREGFANSFLERTTVAFDLEMANDELSRNSFDLHILDADFPQKMKDERKVYLTQYLMHLRKNPTAPYDFRFIASWDADTIPDGFMPGGGNEFRLLWEQHLQEKQNTVVFSISRDAPRMPAG